MSATSPNSPTSHNTPIARQSGCNCSTNWYKCNWLFYIQVFVLVGIVIASVVNLSIHECASTCVCSAWGGLLSFALGYILPSPSIYYIRKKTTTNTKGGRLNGDPAAISRHNSENVESSDS